MAADPDDLALALELADIADSITRERFQATDLKVETKPDLTPVTEADTAVEQACRDRLAVARPNDGVLGEEYGDSSAGSPESRRWIIDPIDGTKNFVRGIPVWGTLIALQVGDTIEVGVASAPALERRWWASRGGGSHVEDRSEAARTLRVSAVHELADAQLSLSGLAGWEARGRLEALLELARRCWRTRGFGDFWHYMLVAEGAVDVVVEPEVSLWDLAAPLVIVEEAGGRFTDFAGTPTAGGGNALASNGLVHDAALEIIGR